MWIDNAGIEQEDIFRCFWYYRQFDEDFPALESAGVIKRIAYNHYEWTENETSLAVYFRWLADTAKRRPSIPGGLWKPIETVFRVNCQALSNMASRYSDPQKRDKYEPFMKIKKIVLKHRKEINQQKEQEQNDREAFTAIKTLVEETNSDDIKEIRAALKKIKTVLI